MCNLKRAHFSSDLVTAIYGVDQQDDPSRKPSGLWYSVDGDWERWCASEGFGDISKQIAHDVRLGAASVLRLTTDAAILAFSEGFAATSTRHRSTLVDWAAVARVYDGIEIAPYSWELRLDCRVDWYYSWDCASGCIWRPCNATVSARPETGQPTG